jgi:hypothetical protein
VKIHPLQTSHLACTSTSIALVLEGYTGVMGSAKEEPCGRPVLALQPQMTPNQLAVMDT